MSQHTAIVNDTQKLTPSQTAELRRRMPGVNWGLAMEAMGKYRYFLQHGGKRPMLHDSRSRIVSPVTSEVVKKLEEFTGMEMMYCEAWWSRQVNRFERSEEGGDKIYEDTIIERMGAKRAKREARKQHMAEVTKPTEVVTVPTVVASAEVVKSMYADIPVVYKKHGPKTTVLVIFNGDRKHAEVYSVENGIGRSVRSSVAQKYTDAELDEKKWKRGKLGDAGFEPILNALELLALPSEYSSPSMEI